MGFRHQVIELLTSRSWFRQLEKYPGEQVRRAAERCVGMVEFISCYAIVQAIETERREYQATHSTVTPLPAKGVPMPPETREAIAVLRRSTLLPDHPDHLPPAQARARVEELAGYLDARLAEQSTAPRRERPA